MEMSQMTSNDVQSQLDIYFNTWMKEAMLEMTSTC